MEQTTNERAKRVIVVEDQTVFREMLVEFLHADPDIRVVAQLGEGAPAITAIDRERPEMVIVDLVLPDISGLDVLRHVRDRHGQTTVLVVTAQQTPSVVLEAYHAGANGIVTKTTSLSQLQQAIRTVAGGGTFYCATTSAVLRDSAKNKHKGEALTERERQIVILIALGNSSKEIAQQLDLSVKTVSNHRLRITRKLGIREIAGLTRYAISRGWVADTPAGSER